VGGNLPGHSANSKRKSAPFEKRKGCGTPVWDFKSMAAGQIEARCERTSSVYEASHTLNSMVTSSLALTPVLPGGLMPNSVCFTLASPV
jgi:hypothetical protein